MKRSEEAGIVISVVIFLLIFHFTNFHLLQQMDEAQAQQLRIKYDYKYEKGKFGIYGIADTAIAYLNEKKIAEATAVRIIEKKPGPNQLEVEEIHFSPSGNVIYKGKIIFRFGFSGAMPEETIAISGRKLLNIFNSWPAGN